MLQGVQNKTKLGALALLMCLMLSVPGMAWAKGEPVSSSPYDDAVAVDMDDGEYVVDVELGGGSGRASVMSPAKLSVLNGKAAVAVEWSSSNYDYMVVAGKQYLPVNPSGNSVFLIPVVAFDEPYDVVGDTTAMSEPHEVDYTLTVDLASVQDFDPSALSSGASSSSAAGSSGTSAATGTESGSSASGGSGAASSAPSAVGGADVTEESSVSMPWVLFIVFAVAAALIAGIAFGIVRGTRNR
ncbi:MAG: hypothetical protein IJ131_00740 [Eggerthellaceae bacterium]|nr:hypothetical protein [Eggerthellaceae bacterium]